MCINQTAKAVTTNKTARITITSPTADQHRLHRPSVHMLPASEAEECAVAG